jgi:hypothetical protein
MTGVAGAIVALPACEAVTEHVPDEITVITAGEPDTVQTAVVVEVNVMGKLREEAAVIVGATSPKVMLALLKVNVRICDCFTANVLVTGVAALNFVACPACDAVIEQLPAETRVTIPVGVTVQTGAVVLAKETGNLLDALATS